jgi:type 1 glutamine amidotransferase
MCTVAPALAALLATAASAGPAAPAQAGARPWAVFQPHDGPGNGRRIVFVTGDEEYRSEESMPQLARILARRHGFRCTVLFAIDPRDGTINPEVNDNIPGLELLDQADLMVIFTRFRDLPDDQMKHIVAYLNSGKPIVGLRTATHAFRFRKHQTYARFDFRSKQPEGGFGRQVLGETWISHYGRHQKESTRGVIAPGMERHPILRGVKDIWGPSDVYEITTLSGDSQPLVLGQVLEGMRPTDKPKPGMKLLPVAWIKTYTGETGETARVFATTMGHADDFKNEGFRRLLVNACYWALGMESQITADSDVNLVGAYDPNPIGSGRHKKGVRPADSVMSRAAPQSQPATAPGKP